MCRDDVIGCIHEACGIAKRPGTARSETRVRAEDDCGFRPPRLLERQEEASGDMENPVAVDGEVERTLCQRVA
jgi:hypothetical protein